MGNSSDPAHEERPIDAIRATQSLGFALFFFAVAITFYAKCDAVPLSQQ
jgi:hypothetical protein